MQLLKINTENKNKGIVAMGLINQSLSFMSCLKRQQIATPLHLGITFEHAVMNGSRLDHLKKFVTSKTQIDLNLDMHSKVKTLVVLKGLKKQELRKVIVKGDFKSSNL